MRLSPVARVRGLFRLPGDKSISHRLALFGALARGRTRVANFSSAGDCASTLRCLAALGVACRRQGHEVEVEGRGFEGLQAPARPLDAGNSGTTLRLLAGVLAAAPFEAELTGDESLRRRPVERVAAPLRAMGAELQSSGGRPPLRVRGGRLRGLHWRSPVASAQVKSAVLLAGLQAEGTTSVSEPALSRDHTERLLPAFGVPVRRDGLTVAVSGGARLSPVEMTVPGDVSSAAFLVVAALVCPGSEVRLEGVLLNPLRTAFLDVLRGMGADLEVEPTAREPEPVGTIVARSSRLGGARVGAEQVPALVDEVPALAVAAAFAEGDFDLTGAEELRLKESDRLAALAEGLQAMGVDVLERPDGLLVRGGARPRGARVRSHGDHRVAMAFSVAALAARGDTELDGAEAAAVSFPEFYDCLRSAARP